MAEPPTDLLIFAFLGDRFARKMKDDRKTYQDLVNETGVSKQNLMKLVRGDTVGMWVFVLLSKSVGGGSMDSLLQMARTWWAGLTPEDRQVVMKRTEEQHARRTSPKRGGGAPEDERLARLEKGVTPRIRSTRGKKVNPARSAPSRKG